jgi:hypothetical protein
MFYCEPLLKYEELFVRESCFISSLEECKSIMEFIKEINFEWKLSLGDYVKYNQFCLEILDVPNRILGLPFVHNWNISTINMDPNSFRGNLQTIKGDILKHLSNFVDCGKKYKNRILIFTIKFDSDKFYNDKSSVPTIGSS